ncbi:MAG TPA: hypothetical protein VGP16_27645, partial [Asanoa sp.]|nr:hypothetical protein [Asanoa sp.]
NYIARADISVTLPGRVPGAGCSIGVGAEEKGCGTVDVAGTTLRVSAADLLPHTPVTVRVGVDVPTPSRATVPWSPRFDPILGRTLTGVMLVGALTLAAVASAYLWWRATSDKAPGFPVQYSPPEGIGPVQSEYIRTLKVSPDALTATLFHLAEHRLITVKQVNEKRWTITGIANHAAWDAMDPVSRKAGYALDVSHPGGEFNANGTAAAGKRLATAKTDLAAAVTAWGSRQRLLRTEKAPAANWLRWTGVLALVIAIVGFAHLGFPATIWGLPFAAFFLCSTPAWRADAGVRRTEEGRRLWAQTQGFHRLISTDSAETRPDFAARRDLFTAYMPYAVVAGISELWARKYATVTGSVAPEPNWYHSATGRSGPRRQVSAAPALAASNPWWSRRSVRTRRRSHRR